MIQVAIPLQGGRFCEHFGGAEAFAFYTVDLASGTVGERRVDTPPEHGRGIFPMWLRNQGTEIVLAGGMGPRAVGIFAQHGIDVVLGVSGDNPDAMVEKYLAGTLDATGQVCHDQGYHDCGHDHGHEHDGRGGCHRG